MHVHIQDQTPRLSAVGVTNVVIDVLIVLKSYATDASCAAIQKGTALNLGLYSVTDVNSKVTPRGIARQR